MSDDIANSFDGTACPFCSKGFLYYVELRTLACSECERSITVDNLMMSQKVPDIVIRTTDDGITREFAAGASITSEELLRELVQAYVLIERCARAEPTNDHLQTLMWITKHSLDNMGVVEGEAGQFTKNPDTVLVNGKDVWMDPSIFEGVEPW